MRGRSGGRSALTASLCLVLAFTITGNRPQVSALQQVPAAQQQPGVEHIAAASQDVGQLPSGPMMSMGSESSAALESSAAIADDLIAAESSQSPDAAEHKSFTSSVPIRQDIGQQQQLAAGLAPQQAVYGGAQQQQAQQMFHQQQQQHMAMRLAHPQQQQQPHHNLVGQQKPFHPAFMAAALAGNYGPAQQQMAAASLHAAQQQGRHPVHQQQMQHPQQQQQHHQQMMPPQHMHQHHHQQQQQQQQAHPGAGRPPMVVAAAAQQEQASSMAVQESSVRQNVVPAPSFSQPSSAMLDSNSIELNDMPSSAAPVGSSSRPSEQTGLAVSGSAQHPVIAPAGSSSIVHDSSQSANSWPLQAPDIPKIVSLEVKCEKNLMKVSIEFDKIFNGVIFSKGHYSQGQCLHVGSNSGKQQAYFDISINSCGTQGNTQNGLYGMGGNTGSGTFFENTIVIQYDPNVQEVYDHARKLRCTWHDQYEKAVTFRPFPVDMLDIVRADFAGDNVGCWMQIQVGRGPWASEVAGIVKIGQTMTMVLAIKDEENKFDMLVRNCFAHDGKRGPIELVDKSGCITRPKLMSRFTKIKNFGSSATVLSYAHFQAFKFPDSMEVHFQCTIQICRHQCPDQCSSGSPLAGGSGSSNGNGETYSESTISGTFNINGGNQANSQGTAGDSVHLRKFGSALSRERRDLGQEADEWQLPGNRSHHHHHHHHQRSFAVKPMIQNVGLNRMIQVVSAGDLAFAIQQQQQSNGSASLDAASASQLTRVDMTSQICMSSYNFVLSLVILVLILLCSCLLAVGLYLRQKSFAKCSSKLSSSPKSSLFSNSSSSSSSSACSSPSSTMRPHVPSKPVQHYADSHLQHSHYHH